MPLKLYLVPKEEEKKKEFLFKQITEWTKGGKLNPYSSKLK